MATTESRKQSAGLLLYRLKGDGTEVLLCHSGGPFWSKKDLASWSIPKGLISAGETPLAAAMREFAEETGHRPRGKSVSLGEARQPGGGKSPGTQETAFAAAREALGKERERRSKRTEKEPNR